MRLETLPVSQYISLQLRVEGGLGGIYNVTCVLVIMSGGILENLVNIYS